MNDDFKMWDIDGILKSYVNEPDMRLNVEFGMECLFGFLERELLLKCKISDGNGRVTKRFIMKSELTDEGLKLAMGPKNPIHRWLGSKGSQKSPPDMRMLEKALSEIRMTGTSS
jgi:hypothetical protein